MSNCKLLIGPGGMMARQAVQSRREDCAHHVDDFLRLSYGILLRLLFPKPPP